MYIYIFIYIYIYIYYAYLNAIRNVLSYRFVWTMTQEFGKRKGLLVMIKSMQDGLD